MFERRVLRDELGDVIQESVPGPRVGSVELHKAQWLLAAQWRRRVAGVCARVGLTFTEWLIIDALRELYQEQQDAVSQNALAARAGLRRGNISESMPALENKNLISRGPSACGRALRLFPTHKAERVLGELYPLLDAVSGPEALTGARARTADARGSTPRLAQCSFLDTKPKAPRHVPPSLSRRASGSEDVRGTPRPRASKSRSP